MKPPRFALSDAVCDFCGKEALCLCLESEFEDSPDLAAICDACALRAVNAIEEYEEDCAAGGGDNDDDD